MAMAVAHLKRNRRSNVDNRAKIFLVNSIMPLIDRMIHEINKLRKSHEDDSVRTERLTYIAEITDTINDYNQMLTEWIQLRQEFPHAGNPGYGEAFADEFPVERHQSGGERQ